MEAAAVEHDARIEGCRDRTRVLEIAFDVVDAEDVSIGVGSRKRLHHHHPHPPIAASHIGPAEAEAVQSPLGIQKYFPLYARSQPQVAATDVAVLEVASIVVCIWELLPRARLSIRVAVVNVAWTGAGRAVVAIEVVLVGALRKRCSLRHICR